MSIHPRPAGALGDFFRARRAELDPVEIGLPAYRGRRRVPGLRREEVAQLAAISHDYYARLEQGRILPSRSVLDALCDVLRLDSEQRKYVGDLAGFMGQDPESDHPALVRPQLQRLLDSMTTVPAFAFNQQLDIVAWNPLAAAVYVDFGLLPQKNRNYVRLMFTNPEFRSRHADWEAAAQDAVGALRRSVAHNTDDVQLAELVEDLSNLDTDFRSWWAAHHVIDSRRGTVSMTHPVVGELTLDWDTYTSEVDLSLRLMVMTTSPRSQTCQSLLFLSSWIDSSALST